MLRTAPALAALIASSLAALCGCAPKQPAAMEPADVTPEMRQMVMQRYQFAVKSLLNTPQSAQFTEPPVITAAREPQWRRVDVTAEGEVNAQNEEGVTTRYRYELTWDQGPGGWRLREKSVTPAED